MLESLLTNGLQLALQVIATLVLLVPSQASAQRMFTPEFTARVVHVDDGDTVVAMLADGQKTKVRLANIDAPEAGHGRCRPGQPFAEKSTQALKSLVHGQQVRFVCTTLDHYDRHICDVHVEGTTANREMARMGMAWANRARAAYLKDQEVAEAERQARAAGRGIWGDPRSVEPWTWRRQAWGQCTG